jgi:hypothetical protein
MTTATADEFSSPAPLPDPDAPVFDRNGVRRSKDGRPYVKMRCVNAAPADGARFVENAGVAEALGDCVNGRVPGKRAGTTKKCPKCDGVTGWKEVLYARCTSFVGALEDRQNLERWMKRTVLIGVAADHRNALDPFEPSTRIIERTLEADLDDRDTLDALADEAFERGDGYLKARKGTDLHALCENVDNGEPLPEGTSLDDRADVAAWRRLRDEYGITVLDVERFVVIDEYKFAGTYDRRIESDDPRLACPVSCGKPRVLDLKTGRIDYGAGKMSQQLAGYAHGVEYDPETGERSPHDVCQHVGFIAHVPQGTASASMHSLDLVAGWRAVDLSAEVREHRRVSKTWMTPLDSGLLLAADTP